MNRYGRHEDLKARKSSKRVYQTGRPNVPLQISSNDFSRSSRCVKLNCLKPWTMWPRTGPKMPQTFAKWIGFDTYHTMILYMLLMHVGQCGNGGILRAGSIFSYSRSFTDRIWTMRAQSVDVHSLPIRPRRTDRNFQLKQRRWSFFDCCMATNSGPSSWNSFLQRTLGKMRIFRGAGYTWPVVTVDLLTSWFSADLHRSVQGKDWMKLVEI